LEENVSLFINEGDGLTSESERIRVLLSLASYAGGYMIMVDVHNTVDVRCTWEVVLSYSGMADVDACHTVDTRRQVKGLTMFARYGKFQHP